MEYVNTEAQAANLLYTRLSVLAKKDCPVFKEKCRTTDCMSFAKGKIHKRSVYNKDIKDYNDKWWVAFPRCESPFVTGYIEAEMVMP